MSGDRGLSRRALLGGTLAIAVAACTGRRPAGRPTPAPDPDAARLAAAIDGENALIAAYDAAAPAAGADARYVASLLAAHQEHLAALQKAAGAAPLPPSSSPSTSSPTPAPTENQLRAAERGSSRQLADSAVSARDGAVAALLASIAAGHAVYGDRRVVHSSGAVRVP
jgi:hypothetical protein